MNIQESVLTTITAHAQREMPHESCGYLAGRDGIVTLSFPMTNTDKAADHFSMAPQEQFAAVKKIRGLGLELIAVYHSHPETPARPSQEDIRLAYDPNIHHVIISLEDPKDIVCKSFTIAKGEVGHDPITVITTTQGEENGA